MGVDIMRSQKGRHGIVKGFQGPPAPVEKIVTSRMKFPAGGHTGKAAGIASIKTDRMFGQTGKVGGDSFITTVRVKQMPVKRIKHDHNYFHIAFASLTA
jgi:hypothetical protein